MGMFDDISTYISTADGMALDRIVNLVKARRTMIAQIHKAQFIVGMNVAFEDKYDNTVYGQIIGIHRKNISIRAIDDTRWSVYPCFVRKTVVNE